MQNGVAGGRRDRKEQKTRIALHLSAIDSVDIPKRAEADPRPLPVTPMDGRAEVVSEWKPHWGRHLFMILITKVCLKIALWFPSLAATRCASLPGYGL